MQINLNDRMVNPGEYIVQSLLLQSYNGLELDLRNNMLEITIHEDIYQNFVIGELLLTENVSLKEHIPLIANEYLTISFTTSSRTTPIAQRFFVYKIDPNMDLGTNTYTIYFSSEAFINCQKTKISRSYTNMPYSDMVKSIYEDYFGSSKPLLVQPTLGSKHVVLPFSNPAKAISWIASRCISNSAKDFSYVFYETLDSYYFTTINYEALLNKDPQITYEEYPANYTYRDGAYRNLEKDFFRIENYAFMTANNALRNITNGVFASGLLTHDITYKKIDYTTFAYNNDYQDLTLMNEHGILPRKNDSFSDYSLAHLRYYPKNSYLFSGISDADEYQNVILKRNAHLSHMETNKLTILVAGDSNRRVGEIVKIKLFSKAAEKNVNDPPYDRYNSGNYMISKITHALQKEQYKMRLELEKDSQASAYPEEKEFVK